MRIAIIGLGSSGTLVLRAIAERLAEGDPVELLLFENQKELGAGVPYGRAFNDQRFILNMQASLLGVHPERPEEFIDWLSHRDPGRIDATDYVQRTHMGEYLEDVLQASLAKLRALRIRYEIVRDEIGDMQVRGNEYLLFGTTQTYTTDRVVLAMGHLRKRERVDGGRRYIANPYHDLDAVRAIAPEARVGIIGSKLTAVDIALLLHQQGVRQIAMFSGSGRLPLVRGKRLPEHELPLATVPEETSLRAFVRSIRKQLDSAGASTSTEYAGFMSEKDEATRLEQELQQASATRPWHALLDQTKHFIDAYWQRLSPFHKRLFLRKYQGLWMSYRHPMPPSNAGKIAQMLREGSLHVHGGYRGVKSESNGLLSVTTRAAQISVDYLIDASGTPADVQEIDSSLLDNLLRNRIVARCEFGGIECDPATHRIRPLSNVYVIGQLSRGRIFYVSALERLSIHAEVIATDLTRSLTVRTEEAPIEVAA